MALKMYDLEAPVELLIDGVPSWCWADGTIIPVVRGAQEGDGDGDGGKGGDGDGDKGGSGDGDGDGDGGKGGDGDGDKGGSGDGDKDGDWKNRSRSWERRAKAALKERDDLKKKESERDAANKTEHEKALDAARKETEDRVRSEAQKELRTERLSSTVARLAAGKFADVDDALLRVEKAIRDGDLEEDEIFVEHKIQSAAVKEWLEKLLTDKPHLAAAPGTRRVTGDGDGGKGSGGGKSEEDMSIEDHLAAISKTKK